MLELALVELPDGSPRIAELQIALSHRIKLLIQEFRRHHQQILIELHEFPELILGHSQLQSPPYYVLYDAQMHPLEDCS